MGWGGGGQGAQEGGECMAVATMVMTGDVDGSWRWPSLSYSQAPENINYNRDHNHAVRFLMLRALRMLRAGLLWRCGRRLQQVPCVCVSFGITTCHSSLTPPVEADGDVQAAAHGGGGAAPAHRKTRI